MKVKAKVLLVDTEETKAQDARIKELVARIKKDVNELESLLNVDITKEEG